MDPLNHVSFNCIGNKRTNDNWQTGMTIPVSSEKKGLSDRYASKGFQDQFYSLLEQGYMSHTLSKDTQALPSIYKMDSVTRIGQEPKRIPHTFYFDDLGQIIEREELDDFTNDEPVVDAITEAISGVIQKNNLADVAKAMVEFGDNMTGEFITDSGIDISGLKAMIERSREQTTHIQPFLGPIYSEANWKHIAVAAEKAFKSLKEQHQDGIKELIWLGPSDSFWGKSSRFSSVKSWFVENAKTKGKNPKSLFTPKFYFPVAGENDRRGVSDWKNQLGNVSECYKYIEGFFNGTTEVLILSESFAVVCYHLSIPTISNLSIPMGFTTTDMKLVKVIENLLKNYLNETVGFENPIDLGKL